MKRKLTSAFLILFLVVLLFSSSAFASDGLNIDRWSVDAKLLETGDLQVSEDILFNFSDKFNGVYRNIMLDKIDGVEDLSVYELVSGEEIKYEKVEQAEKGDANKFTTKIEDNTREIQIFSPSENEKKTFRLQYKLSNVAVKHEDTGELYYKFLGEENETDIDYFSINLSLPDFHKDRIKIFAHGPQQGKIYFSDGSIKSEISDVEAGEFIENRILFPIQYIEGSKNIGGKTFQGIIKEEEEFAKELQEEKEAKIRRKNLFTTISIISGLIGLFIIAFLFYKFRRDPSVFDKMEAPYPNYIPPAELSLFFNKAQTPRSLLASLFNLSYKGFIEIEEFGEDIENKKVKNKLKKDETLEFTFRKTKEDTKDLNSHQTFLLGWLFNKIGDGKALSTLDIENYRDNNLKEFTDSEKEWKELVKESLESRDYYDKEARKLSVPLMLLYIPYIIVAVLSFIFESFYGFIPLAVGSVILVYGIYLLNRTNDKGYIQHKLWKDFKKNIEKNSKNLLDIDDDKVLIYSLALLLPMKDLEEYRKSISYSYYPIGWGYMYFLMNKHGGSLFEDSFTSSFYGFTHTSSSSSPGVGGGGGFSAGGGGGAGGGGAGGF